MWMVYKPTGRRNPACGHFLFGCYTIGCMKLVHKQGIEPKQKILIKKNIYGKEFLL